MLPSDITYYNFIIDNNELANKKLRVIMMKNIRTKMVMQERRMHQRKDSGTKIGSYTEHHKDENISIRRKGYKDNR